MQRLLFALALLSCAPAFAEPEPEIKRVVIEDDQVRIEELRVRGHLQQVTVRNKRSAAPDYQIIVPRGGSDPSKERSPSAPRVWQLFSF